MVEKSANNCIWYLLLLFSSDKIVGKCHEVSSFHSCKPSFNLRALLCSGRSSRKSKPSRDFPDIEGWSLSKRADADCDNIEDCVASAANEEVESLYLNMLLE